MIRHRSSAEAFLRESDVHVRLDLNVIRLTCTQETRIALRIEHVDSFDKRDPDRGSGSRLRSAKHPQGLPDLFPEIPVRIAYLKIRIFVRSIQTEVQLGRRNPCNHIRLRAV